MYSTGRTDESITNLNSEFYSESNIQKKFKCTISNSIEDDGDSGFSNASKSSSTCENHLPTKNISAEIFDKYRISQMNVITFQGTANFLAMIYPSSFIIEGITYKSVEHFYQAQKIRELVNENHAKTIIAVNDTTSVRRVAQGILKRCRVDPNITKRWKMNRCANVLYHGVWSKFRQCPELASKLLKTEYKLLINSFDGDDIFTSGCSPVQLREWVRVHFGCVIEVPYEFLPADQFPVIAQGYNILGVVTMWVRKELRNLYQRTEKKTNVSKRSDDVTDLLSGLSISKRN